MRRNILIKVWHCENKSEEDGYEMVVWHCENESKTIEIVVSDILFTSLLEI